MVQVPSSVTLTSFELNLVEDAEISKLVVSWRTSAEIDTIGFHLLRSDDGTFAGATQITEQLIQSKGSDGGYYTKCPSKYHE